MTVRQFFGALLLLLVFGLVFAGLIAKHGLIGFLVGLGFSIGLIAAAFFGTYLLLDDGS